MRHLILSLGDAFSAKTLGPMLRSVGVGLDKLGVGIAKYEYVEKYNRSVRNVPTENAVPDLGNTNFVAPTATVIGDVTTGKDSSIWYGASIRGDLHKVEIGDETIIQDLTNIRRKGNSSGDVKIGRNVFIGPNCSIGASTIMDNAFISMGASVGDNCTIESYSVVAAGAIVPDGTVVKSGEIFAGNPAVMLRKVTLEEREALNEHVAEIRELAAVHSQEAEKTFEQLFHDDLEREADITNNFAEKLWKQMEKRGFMDSVHDRHQVHDVLVEKNRRQLRNEDVMRSLDEPDWKPFSEDGEVYPEEWKKYGENMARQQESRELFQKPTPKMPDTNLRAFPKDQTPWIKRY